MKNIVYIDGQNFLYKATEILVERLDKRQAGFNQFRY